MTTYNHDIRHSSTASALWACLAVLTMASGPFKAAQLALIPQILTGDRYVSGMALRQVTGQTAQLLGFAAGGGVLAILEPHIGLLINAATFVASAVWVAIGVRGRPAAQRATATTTPRPAPSGRAPRRAGRRGLVPVPLVVLVCVIGLYVVPEGLAAPYAHGLRIASIGVAVLMAADPAGSVVGAWLLARLRLPTSTGVAATLATVAGLPLIVTAVHPGLVITAALWALSGAFSTAYLIQTQTLIATSLPNHRRGQVLGRMSTCMYASQGVAILGGGFLTQEVVGPATAIAVAGLLATVQ
jgi:hypothetical protein